MFLPRAQSYYRTSLGGGAYQGLPAQSGQAYSRPAPFVHHEVHQQPRQYRQQAVPSLETETSQCRVEYVERSEDVCVPTFSTNCDKEDLASGVVIRHREECYSVTKTVCTEVTDIDDMEVCATRLNMISQEAEAKIVSAVWREECHQETGDCLPAPAAGYHSPGCAQSVRHVCTQSPSLVPVTKTVSVKLPQPVQTCIIKQVKERRCVMAANTEPGQTVKMDKCTVEVGDQQCTEVILQLPRQACPARVNKTLSYGGYSG